MKTKIKVASAIAACFALSGCGINNFSQFGQSEAFRLGYSHAAELNSPKNNDEVYAYSFCFTIAQNMFQTTSQKEFDDYVAGCMDYVMSK